MAPHSSTLAWRIPGTGEPGGLPTIGAHRVGHDWSNLAAAAAVVNNPPASAGDVRDTGVIPGLGQFLGGENGNPLQYSRLENPLNRGAWQAMVHKAAKSQTWLKWLSTQHQEAMEDSGVWCVTVHGVLESDTTYQLNNSNNNNVIYDYTVCSSFKLTSFTYYCCC